MKQDQGNRISDSNLNCRRILPHEVLSFASSHRGSDCSFLHGTPNQLASIFLGRFEGVYYTPEENSNHQAKHRIVQVSMQLARDERVCLHVLPGTRLHQ